MLPMCPQIKKWRRFAATQCLPMVLKIAAFVDSSFFAYFVVPLVASGLGVFVKTVSRNDRYTPFRKEDLAVGLDISLGALLVFISYSVSLAHQMVTLHGLATTEVQDKVYTAPWLLLFWAFGLWGVSTLVRKLGWQNDDELRWFFGIIIPLLFGLFNLVFVMNWIRS